MQVKSFRFLLLAVIVALLGGAILLAASFFFTSGHDYTQKKTIGVITEHGLPFPFAFSASGNAWTNFSGYAAIVDYSIFFVFILILIYVFFQKK